MTVDIEGITLHLAHPDDLSVRWVGQEELMRQLLAAWMVVTEADIPMNPRLIGNVRLVRRHRIQGGGATPIRLRA